jgi:hypothetical protein
MFQMPCGPDKRHALLKAAGPQSPTKTRKTQAATHEAKLFHTMRFGPIIDGTPGEVSARHVYLHRSSFYSCLDDN